MKRSMRLWLTLGLTAAFVLTLRLVLSQVSATAAHRTLGMLNPQAPSSNAKPDDPQATSWLRGRLSPHLTMGDVIDFPDESESPQVIRALFESGLALLLSPESAGRLVLRTQANTLLVTNTNDSGPGSLRQAMLDANASAGPDDIIFNIPATDPGFASGVFTINLASQLPVITGGGVIIDGLTQIAFSGATNGSNPVIVINGTGAGTASGFVLQSDNNVIRKLTIFGFSAADQAAVAIQNGASNNVIESCLIGTNSAGTEAAGNTVGVLVDSGARNNTIGGIAAGTRNIISGNTIGVLLSDDATSGNVIVGNFIGTTASGEAALPNGEGLRIENGANNNWIGGALPGEGNVIADQMGNGVTITGSSINNRVSGNFIFNSGGLGIDLGDDGPTANDSGDGDSGPNNLQNFPVITSAFTRGGRLFVAGNIDTGAGEVRIELFSNVACNGSGFGEGQNFLGAVTVQATGDPMNPATFTTDFPAPAVTSFITATATDQSGNTSEFSACVVTNTAPIADAGPDQAVDERTEVTLNGTGSRDDDGDPLTFHWQQTAGPTVTLSDSTSSQPRFTAPILLRTDPVQVVLTFELVVNDGKVDSEPDTVNITVNNINQKPVANAGPDQTVNEATTVTLDGTLSSDLDQDTLTFRWQQTAGPTVSLSDPTSPRPTFTMPTLKRTDPPQVTLTFTLIVNDGTVDSEPDSVVITVNNINQKPVANAGPDQTVNEATEVTLDGSASSDPDDDPLTYRWQQVGGQQVTLSDPTLPRPSFTAPALKRTDPPSIALTFELTVNDGTATSEPSRVTITVNNINRPPVANAGPDQTVNEATTVTLNGTGSTDPDDDPLTFSWRQIAGPPVTLSDSTSSQPSFQAPTLTRNDPAEITLSFELIVNDGQATSGPDTVDIRVINVNQPPVANAGPDQSVDELAPVTLDGSASSDVDLDPLSFQWQQVAGPSVVLSDPTAAKPTFTAPLLKRTDPPTVTLTFQLIVSDEAATSAPDAVDIIVRNINQPPVANAGPDQTVNEATTVTLNGTGSTDPDDDPLTFSWRQIAGPPVTLSDSISSQPSFQAPTLTRNDPAEITLSFELIVNDGQATSGPDTVDIRVINVNQPPVANAGPDQSVDELALVTLDGSASSDVDLDPLSFQWQQVAGPLVTLSDAAAAKPTFTAPLLKRTDPPTVTLTFQLIVSDEAATSNPDAVDIIVRNINQPPVANAGPDQSVNGGTLVTLDGTRSTDLDDDPLTFSWRQTAGPPVTLSDPTSPSPTFTAPTDPSLPPPLILTFELIVNDSTVDSAPDTVTITVNRKPIADAGPDQKVDEGTTVTLDGTASRDPDGDPITFLWKQVTGPTVQLSNPTASKPTFVAPTVDPAVPPPVVLTFELVVSDGRLTSEPDRVNITINRKPIANAGPDQKVNEGTTVTLDGTASRDPDGDAITFLWKQTAGPSVTLSDATSPRPRFTAPVVSPTVPPPVTLTFELVVNDSRLSSLPDTVVITVNRRPIANAGPDQTVTDGSAVTLDGTASRDPDGDPITYRWQQTAGLTVTLIGATGSKPSFTAPNLLVTDPPSVVLTFSLVVNDGRLDSTPDTIDVTVQNVVRLDDRNRNGNYLEINLATNAFEFRAERTGQVFTGTITNITRGAGDGNQIRMSGSGSGGSSLAVNIDVRRNVATAVLTTGSDTFTIFTSNIQ